MPDEEECIHQYVRVDSGTANLLVLVCVLCHNEKFTEL